MTDCVTENLQNGSPSADERERLAAEYVLGVLDRAETILCERLEADDPRFAANVQAWRLRMADLDDTAPPQAPGAALWPRIQKNLDSSVEPGADVSRTQTDRLMPRTQTRPRARRVMPLWSNLPVWRGIGLAASAASVFLAVGLSVLMRERIAAPVLVAVMLNDVSSRPAAVVNAFRDGRIELVPLEAIQVPTGRTLQFWTLWDRARGPVSLGVLDGLKSIDLKRGDLPPTRSDQLFEITLEPAGGSPTGRPTGPILMKGNASQAL